MSTIPKDVLEKIEEKYKHCEFYDGTQSPDYDIMVNQLRYAAEYGYQLATDGREELETRIGQLEKYNEEIINDSFKQHDQITALQSSLKEKEKLIEDLKLELHVSQMGWADALKKLKSK